jgi:hypothetical protein
MQIFKISFFEQHHSTVIPYPIDRERECIDRHCHLAAEFLFSINKRQFLHVCAELILCERVTQWVMKNDDH